MAIGLRFKIYRFKFVKYETFVKVTTGMVMVGGADDLLRVSTLKKKLEGVTQSMVDR